MPAKTPRRAKKARCSTESSPKLQSIAARSVCWRAAASAPVDQQLEAVLQADPDRRRARRRSGQRRARWPGGPSSARHTAAMSPATASSTSRPGRTAAARSMNNATAACAVISAGVASRGGRSRGGTGQANSPDRPSGRRLVASTCTPDDECSTADASRATEATTCSHVSSTSSACCAPSVSAITRTGSSPGATVTPADAATVGPPARGRRSGSDRRTTPDPAAGRSGRSRAGLARPAGPVSVRLDGDPGVVKTGELRRSADSGDNGIGRRPTASGA